MLDVRTRHLRLVSSHDPIESFNRASHSDALSEMQILPFAEHVQADPIAIAKSIPRADFIWTAALFLFAGIGIGAFFAMGGTQ